MMEAANYFWDLNFTSFKNHKNIVITLAFSWAKLMM